MRSTNIIEMLFYIFASTPFTCFLFFFLLFYFSGQRGMHFILMSQTQDTVFRAALITGIRRLGNYLGLEVPDKNPKCDCLRRVYKKVCCAFYRLC